MSERFERVEGILRTLMLALLSAILILFALYRISGNEGFAVAIFLVFAAYIFVFGARVFWIKASGLHYECMNQYAVSSNSCAEYVPTEWNDWALAEHGREQQEERDARPQRWTGESAARVVRKAPVKTS